MMIALERFSLIRIFFKDLLEIILTLFAPCEGIVKFRHTILVKQIWKILINRVPIEIATDNFNVPREIIESDRF